MGVFTAVLAALSWGGGEYSGGRASQRLNQFQVLALSAITGCGILGLLGVLVGESIPTLPSYILAGVAGALGAVGIAALYLGLAVGPAAVVAPIAAVVGAVIPVLFSLMREGPPDERQGLGFVIAIAGLWTVSGTGRRAGHATRKNLALALFAGFGFGGFFIFIDQVQPGSNYLTLLVARLASFAVAMAALRIQRFPFPDPVKNPIAILTGVLDTGGNVFFLLASQLARLDVAVVLASLYPAVTVILSKTLIQEPVLRQQWLGVGLCILAVVLMTI